LQELHHLFARTPEWKETLDHSGICEDEEEESEWHIEDEKKPVDSGDNQTSSYCGCEKKCQGQQPGQPHVAKGLHHVRSRSWSIGAA
jgi:hypothetical protein